MQWQNDKLETVLEALGLKYSVESITRRLLLARNWLTKYNPEEVIVLNKNINKEYSSLMTDTRKERIKRLYNELVKSKDATIQELEVLVYDIPKSPDLSEDELRKEQRAFFKDVYNLLINKDTGPRLGTFLWAVDREQVLKLLNILS